MTVDPVTLNIVGQAINTLTREASANLMRAAYSTIVREVQDASVALLDAEGNVVAQATNQAIHLNSMTTAFQGCAQKHTVGTIAPDEVFVTNDPYRGAQHLPDIFVFTPIFWEGRLIAFGASCVHHLDVGGAAPSSLYPAARDLYAEGLILPALKVNVTDAFNSGLFAEIFAANVRMPQLTVGDLNAQLVANHTCRTRLLAVVKKYGLGVVLGCMQGVMDYSERRTREVIEKIPDGTYRAAEPIDRPTFAENDLEIQVAVTVEGSNLHVDFAGTSPQVKGPINSPFSATTSAVHTAVKAILTGEDVPANAGCYRPVTIKVPYGTILNPRPPAPVRARVNTADRALDAVLHALAQVLPQRVSAPGFFVDTMIALSHLSERGVEVFTEPVSGGFGGNFFRDGANSCGTPMGNVLNTPVEALETDYDFLRVRAYELLKDSAGAGEHSGSMGVRRDIEIRKNDVTFTGFADRHQHKPWGLFGGHEGTSGAFIVTRNSKRIQLAALSAFDLRKGDVLSIYCGGGGGYGEPRNRKRELVLKDLEEERISPEKAREVYGEMVEPLSP